MLIVVALGGNALIRRGQPLEARVQQANTAIAAQGLASIVDAGHQIVVTHGNGPQVGLLALQNEAYTSVRPYPLDVLGAESQGMIGYLVAQELRNTRARPDVATLLTQVIVDASDPAFRQPTKPIGPGYTATAARDLAAAFGWVVGPDGDGWRRLVASPEPRRIVELAAIRTLVAAGVTVICAGGGGIPVVEGDGGSRRGVEAVIDKDLSAALLATELSADVLLLLADVDAVYTAWATPEAHSLRQTTAVELRAMRFAPGSMAPKIEAACRFVEAGGRFAAIGALEDGLAILRGERGTRITLTP